MVVVFSLHSVSKFVCKHGCFLSLNWGEAFILSTYTDIVYLVISVTTELHTVFSELITDSNETEVKLSLILLITIVFLYFDLTIYCNTWNFINYFHFIKLKCAFSVNMCSANGFFHYFSYLFVAHKQSFVTHMCYSFSSHV